MNFPISYSEKSHGNMGKKLLVVLVVIWKKLTQRNVKWIQNYIYCFGLTVNLKEQVRWALYVTMYFKENINLRKMVIPSCKHSSDRYNFNILGVIVIVYQVYIERELYNLL